MAKQLYVKVEGRANGGQGQAVPIQPQDTLADLKQKLGLSPRADMNFVSESRGGSLPDTEPIYDYVQEDEVFNATPGLRLG